MGSPGCTGVKEPAGWHALQSPSRSQLVSECFLLPPLSKPPGTPAALLRTRVLNRECASEPLGGPVKPSPLGPAPQVSNCVAPEQGPGICISQGTPMLLLPGPHLEERRLRPSGSAANKCLAGGNHAALPQQPSEYADKKEFHSRPHGRQSLPHRHMFLPDSFRANCPTGSSRPCTCCSCDVHFITTHSGQQGQQNRWTVEGVAGPER